jgi:succinate dehydrogenase / fumarate reductase flavoprotein subunit
VEGENPYAIHADLQETMQTLVGIIRTESDLAKAVEEIRMLADRAATARAVGGRRYNPGWHLALDLQALLAVSECCARAALERRESRGGHTRDDYPDPDSEFAKVNVACRLTGEGITIRQEPLPEMPEELRKVIEEAPA